MTPGAQSPPARPAPTASPAPKTGRAPLEFSIPSLQPAPAGILPRVSVLQTGGGGGDSGPDCENQPGAPRWCRPLNGASLPLTAEYRGTACGLGDQPVQAVLILPDGSSQPLQVEGQAPFCREISYPSGPTSAPGRYQVRVEQAGTALVDTFQFAPPNRPLGIRLENCAWLAGLAPNQPLRLLVFGMGAHDSETDPLLGTWRYLAALDLSAGPDGMLWACPDSVLQNSYAELAYLANTPAGLLALGEEDLLQSFQGNCADGPLTRLSVNARIRVLNKGLPIFADATLDGRPLGSLEAGSKGTILSGPVCPAQGPWTWKASFDSGLTGWLAESDVASYFIEPDR